MRKEDTCMIYCCTGGERKSWLVIPMFPLNKTDTYRQMDLPITHSHSHNLTPDPKPLNSDSGRERNILTLKTPIQIANPRYYSGHHFNSH